MSAISMSPYTLTQHEMQGRRLGAIRASKHVSQRRIAKILDVQYTVVSKVVTGERRTWWVRAALAHLVGMPYEWFWGEPCPPPPGAWDARTLRDRAKLVYCARSAATEPIKPLLKCLNCKHTAGCGGEK